MLYSLNWQPCAIQWVWCYLVHHEHLNLVSILHGVFEMPCSNMVLMIAIIEVKVLHYRSSWRENPELVLRLSAAKREQMVFILSTYDPFNPIMVACVNIETCVCCRGSPSSISS